MMQITLTKIEGIGGLVAKLNQCGENIRRKGIRNACQGAGKILKKELRTALDNVSPSAPGSAPGVVTGNLRNSVDYVHRKKNPGHEYTIVGHAKNSKGFSGNHAHLLENGTVNMAARPYFKPTFQKNVDPMLNEMAVQIEKVIYE